MSGDPQYQQIFLDRPHSSLQQQLLPMATNTVFTDPPPHRTCLVCVSATQQTRELCTLSAYRVESTFHETNVFKSVKNQKVLVHSVALF
jgi:hypothetical protein